MNMSGSAQGRSITISMQRSWERRADGILPTRPSRQTGIKKRRRMVTYVLGECAIEWLK